MHNVFWLRPNVIAGRTGPNKDFWEPTALAQGGIGAVLSVNDGELVHPEDLAAAGIRYQCVPLSDVAPPRPGDLEMCTAALPKALEFALLSIDAGRGLLVHCPFLERLERQSSLEHLEECFPLAEHRRGCICHAPDR